MSPTVLQTNLSVLSSVPVASQIDLKVYLQNYAGFELGSLVVLIVIGELTH